MRRLVMLGKHRPRQIGIPGPSSDAQPVRRLITIVRGVELAGGGLVVGQGAVGDAEGLAGSEGWLSSSAIGLTDVSGFAQADADFPESSLFAGWKRLFARADPGALPDDPLVAIAAATVSRQEVPDVRPGKGSSGI